MTGGRSPPLPDVLVALVTKISLYFVLAKTRRGWYLPLDD